MRSVHVIVATEGPDTNGIKFSKEALEHMVERATKVPVTYNFRDDMPPLGSVDRAVLTDKGLELDISLSNMIPDVNKYFVVPLGVVCESHLDGGYEVLDDIISTGFTLTPIPAVPKLPTIPKRRNDGH